MNRLKLFNKSISLFIIFLVLMSIVVAVTTFSVTLNSPDNNTYTDDNTPVLNVTVSGTEQYYACEVLIGNVGYGIYNDFMLVGSTVDNDAVYSSVIVNGSYIYLAKTGGLTPCVYSFDGITFTGLDYLNIFHSQALWVTTDYIYSGSTSSLRAYSFDGSSFSLLDTVSTSGMSDEYYMDIWSDGTYIYTTQFEDGLTAYTFNGTDLIEVGSIDEVISPAQGRGVFGDGTYIYMAKGSGGIVAYTFNGTDFTNVGSRDDGYTFDLFINGSYIYSANGAGGLYVYSFDGSTFTVEDSIDNGGTAVDVYSTTEYVYLANYVDGVRVYTFDGSMLINVGHIDDSDDVNSVSSDGTYIYTTDYYEGLKVYTFPGLLNNSATILTINTSLSDGSYDWSVNCTSNVTTYSSETRLITIDTIAPTVLISELYPAIPISTDTLILNISCSDTTTPDNITGYWNIYKNSVLQSSLSGSVSILNDTLTTVQTIMSGNVSASDIWYGTIICGDLTTNSTTINTTLRSVQPEFSVTLNSHTDNSYTQDTEPIYNVTVQGSVSEYFCELIIDTLGYYINATVLNATDTLFITNSTLSQGSHDWNITCQSGTVINSSDQRTLTIDNVAPVINSNQTSILVPIYGDTINITANVTDITSTVSVCYFNLTDPDSNIVINNVNGTQVGTIWNSTTYTVNVSGIWTVNISCQDLALNTVSSSWTFRSDLGNITQIPTSKIYSQIAGIIETFNLTISHTGNNNNTLDFAVVGDIADTNNFTVSFSENSTTIEESETQIVTVSIDSNSTLNVGTFIGNLTWNRTEDGTTGVITVTIYISSAVGNVVSTPKILTSLAVYDNSITTTTVNITNDGTRLLNNCNISIDTSLGTYTIFNNSNFNVSINKSEIIQLTITKPIIDIYDTTLTTTCVSTDEGGYDSDTSSLIVSVTTQVIIVTGGGSGDGYTSDCNYDFYCDFGETISTCPTDCTFPLYLKPSEINVTFDFKFLSLSQLTTLTLHNNVSRDIENVSIYFLPTEDDDESYLNALIDLKFARFSNISSTILSKSPTNPGFIYVNFISVLSENQTNGSYYIAINAQGIEEKYLVTLQSSEGFSSESTGIIFLFVLFFGTIIVLLLR